MVRTGAARHVEKHHPLNQSIWAWETGRSFSQRVGTTYGGTSLLRRASFATLPSRRSWTTDCDCWNYATVVVVLLESQSSPGSSVLVERQLWSCDDGKALDASDRLPNLHPDQISISAVTYRGSILLGTISILGSVTLSARGFLRRSLKGYDGEEYTSADDLGIISINNVMPILYVRLTTGSGKTRNPMNLG